jgi:MFS family permease
MTAPPSPPGSRRSFALLWAGQAVSQLGDAVFLTTLLLWVADLTDSPAAVGLLFVFEAIPILLVSPLAGVFVDRWPYKRTLIRSDLGRALLVLPLVFVQTESGLWFIYLDVFLVSVLTRFFFPGLMASLPGIVGDERLPAATSSIRATLSIAFIVGPLIAAPLFVAVGPETALLANSASFAVSAILLAFCRFDESGRGVAASGLHRVCKELVEGFRLVLTSRLQKTILATGALVMLGAGAINALNIFFIDEALDRSRSFIGLADGLQGLGFALGALAVVPLSSRLPLTRMIGLGALVMGIFTILYSQMELLVPALGLVALLGLGNGLADTAAQTVTIQRTDPSARGRILSLHSTAANASLIVAAGAAGFAAEIFDLRALMASAGILFLLAAALASWYLSRLPEDELRLEDSGEAVALDDLLAADTAEPMPTGGSAVAGE